MTRTAAAVLTLVAALAVGCKQEPTIVIRYEARDLGSGGDRPHASDAAARDLAPSEAAAKDLAPSAPFAPSAAAPTPGKECKVAADCVVEPVDCCDCANGGKQHAIAMRTAAAARRARKGRCKDVLCTMMLSTDPSCGARAGCLEGRCVLVKK